MGMQCGKCPVADRVMAALGVYEDGDGIGPVKRAIEEAVFEAGKLAVRTQGLTITAKAGDVILMRVPAGTPVQAVQAMGDRFNDGEIFPKGVKVVIVALDELDVTKIEMQEGGLWGAAAGE